MFELLKKLFQRRDKRFPRYVEGHTYCIDWYCYLRGPAGYKGSNLCNDEANSHSPAEGEVAFNHYRCGIWNSDTSGLIDGLVPAIRFGNTVGLYKVLRRYARYGYDGAEWDNGCTVDLQFVRTVEVFRQVEVDDA